jgi:hypothetical protein
MIGALERAAEILGLGLADLDASVVPPRRLAELSRYGMEGKATLLRRHPDGRRLSTLLATVVYLQTHAVDDALDLLDVLITSKLLARAERESAKQKIRAFPKLGRASITMAAAVNVLLEITAAGEEVAARAEHDGVPFEPVGLAQVWAQIETVASRADLARAMTDIVDLAGPADDDADAAWRVELVKRYQTVRPFLPLLCQVIRFGASPDVDYRRTMKSQGNLQEGRHSLGREIFHGKRGELRQRYYEGMEDQLGALGLVLNAIVLFNTRYLDAAITELRAGGHEVRGEDAARLSPFGRNHINLLGRYSFLLPGELGGGLRPLRDPSTIDADEEDSESI